MFKKKPSYLDLPNKFYSKVLPSPVLNPKLYLWNNDLEKELMLDLEKEDRQEFFSGNQLMNESVPLAMAYAGHQFGHFNMLGDGRALLLGEIEKNDGALIDVQLKGAGTTPYSRRGDGRGTLSSMMREFIISEAMFNLNVPTSRSLAVVGTGEELARQEVEESAVLTRLASSHIRVGTFEYARAFLSVGELNELLVYSIKRHYPNLLAAENPALGFVSVVMEKQIRLIIDWMRVGFIHGVMNTDNVAISGETIDYGPCAFMNTYHPKTVFSSIDRNARYAYGNQPNIGQWNVSCLAGAVLPLIHENENIAVDMVEQLLNEYPNVFQTEFMKMSAHKIGFHAIDNDVITLVKELQRIMQIDSLDFTNTFLYLEGVGEDLILPSDALLNWKVKWENLLSLKKISRKSAVDLMEKSNPYIIPRNHLVEKALADVRENNDFTFFNELFNLLKFPYNRKQIDVNFLMPDPNDAGYKTYCGT